MTCPICGGQEWMGSIGLFCPNCQTRIYPIDADERRKLIGKVPTVLHGDICDTCNGRGEVECDECNGTGSIDCDCNCPYCDHEDDCDVCDGSGFVECEECEGKCERKAKQ